MASDGVKADAAGDSGWWCRRSPPTWESRSFRRSKSLISRRSEHVGIPRASRRSCATSSLTRGVTVRAGSSTGASGRPVRGSVHYFLLAREPEVRRAPTLICVESGAHRRRRLVLHRRPGRPGVAGRRPLRPVYQGRRQRSDQGGETARFAGIETYDASPLTRTPRCSMPWSSSTCLPTRAAWSTRSSSSPRSDAGRIRAR